MVKRYVLVPSLVLANRVMFGLTNAIIKTYSNYERVVLGICNRLDKREDARIRIRYPNAD